MSTEMVTISFRVRICRIRNCLFKSVFSEDGLNHVAYKKLARPRPFDQIAMQSLCDCLLLRAPSDSSSNLSFAGSGTLGI